MRVRIYTILYIYIYIYISTHTESEVLVSVCFCVHVPNVSAWQHLCKLDAVCLYSSLYSNNIADQFVLSGQFGFPQ